jgi:hypothetical protein
VVCDAALAAAYQEMQIGLQLRRVHMPVYRP